MKKNILNQEWVWEVDGFNVTSVIEKQNEVGWKHLCTCDYGYADPDKFFEENKINAQIISAMPEAFKALSEIINSDVLKENAVLLDKCKFAFNKAGLVW